MINSFYEGVIVTCCVNIIAVLGMSVLTGFTRLFSFGNAGFMAIGAYTAAICSVQFHLPFALAILCGAIAAGIVAYLLGSLTIRLRGDYFLISCLGFGECVRVLFLYQVGTIESRILLSNHLQTYFLIVREILWCFTESIKENHIWDFLTRKPAPSAARPWDFSAECSAKTLPTAHTCAATAAKSASPTRP